MSRRIVWMFTSISSASYGAEVDWSTRVLTNNYYASHGMYSEGFWYMFKRMLEEKIVDEVLIIIESMRGPGSITYGPGFSCIVLPTITEIWKFLRDDDIILCRGGFKSWFLVLTKMMEEKRWILFYRAATQRYNWPFWDIVLNDLIDHDLMDGQGRAHFRFRKPTNVEIFKPMKEERKYDVCIGASHIHDKKGQWRGVNVFTEYRRLFHTELKGVLPGSGRGGAETNEIPRKIRRECLSIDMPGMVERDKVAVLMNQSKLFIHLGGAGQNDRGVLESLRCGTPVLLGSPEYHDPFTYTNSDVSYVTKNANNPEELAKEIHAVLPTCTEEKRQRVFDYHEEQSGFDNVVLPQMKRIMDFVNKYPVADRTKTPELLNE